MELSELFVSAGSRTLFELNFFAVFCCVREKFIFFFFEIEALFHQDAKRVIKLYAIELSELFLRLRKVCVKGKSYFL